MLKRQVLHNIWKMDQHPAVVYLDSLPSDEGRRAMGRALNKMAELLGHFNMLAVEWSQLRYKDTAALRYKLLEIYEPPTFNKSLIALHSVLKYAYLLGQMSAKDYREAIQLKETEINAIPIGREPSYKEITALIQACGSGTPVGIRDAAIIALLYSAGLRPTEIVNLDLYDYSNGELVIKDGLNQSRTVYVVDDASGALKNWLAIRGNQAGPLFLSLTKCETCQPDKRMTSRSIGEMLLRRSEDASIERYTPNDLRRSFINRLLEAGVDIVMVGQIAGIKDLDNLFPVLVR